MPVSQRVAALGQFDYLSICKQLPESELNLRLMRLMDEHYLDYPE